MELTLKDIRAAVKQLKSRSVKNIKLPMRTDIRLTVGGVVWIPGIGFMHLESFRDMAGEEACQWLLAQPRVVTSYDTEMKILIAVKGCKAHLNRWIAQAETWAVGDVLIAFFTGDELHIPDDYDHLPEKTQAICKAVKHDFAFLCDTDTYVSIPRLLASGFEAHDYTGYQLEGKSYASGGAGYWLSKKAMNIIAAADVSGFKNEDEMAGTILAAHGIKLHHDPRYALYADVLPGNDIISRHLSSRGPYKVEMMYEAHRKATDERNYSSSYLGLAARGTSL